MAVSKLWPVTVRLATVLDYASNPEKTTKSKSKYSDADYQALRDVVAYARSRWLGQDERPHYPRDDGTVRSAL